MNIRAHSLRGRTAFIKAFTMVFTGALVSSAIIAFWTQPVFVSTARIEVEKDPPVKFGTDGPRLNWEADTRSLDPYFLNTEFKIIKSFRILTNVIIKLNLQHVLASQAREADWSLDKTYDNVAKQIEVGQAPGSSLISISVKNPSPDTASKIANTICDAYRHFRIERWYVNCGWILAAWHDKPPDRVIVDMSLPQQVVIDSPAGSDLNSVVRTKPKIFLMGILGGTLLAVLAGGGNAWRLGQRIAR